MTMKLATPERARGGQPLTSNVVDLRSDTVTRPTPEMRRAMFEAEVGDDVYGEDPTMNRLEQRAAEIFHRDAAIFVPTGTMGNQIAIKLHTQPGQEVICEERAHIVNWEMAMLATFSGCLLRTVATPDGVVTWPQIQKKIAPKIYSHAQTGLVSLENTHNMAGGIVLPLEVTEEICHQAHQAGIPVHLDGARIFNASVATGKTVVELTGNFDSVMFCLSKGLAAPVGSLLVGSRQFIARARSVRKALGGGMRQAGILAAAGLVALEKGPARLKQDHANAKFLAEGLTKIPGIRIEPSKVVTNIVIFDVRGTGWSSSDLCAKLAQRSVLMSGIDSETIRLVTHLDVDRSACEYALEALRSASINRTSVAVH